MKKEKERERLSTPKKTEPPQRETYCMQVLYRTLWDYTQHNGKTSPMILRPQQFHNSINYKLIPSPPRCCSFLSFSTSSACSRNWSEGAKEMRLNRKQVKMTLKMLRKISLKKFGTQFPTISTTGVFSLPLIVYEGRNKFLVSKETVVLHRSESET